MDRFEQSDGLLFPGEEMITKQQGIQIFDGDYQCGCDNGTLILTSHRIVWRDGYNQSRVFAMPLSLVVFSETQQMPPHYTPKIICHLYLPSKPSNAFQRSPNNYIQFIFISGGAKEFFCHLTDALAQRRWEVAQRQPSKVIQKPSGILGIERTLQEKQRKTDQNISKAFEDLSKLMQMAKEMVTLSKTITTKIREKQGDISDDETVRFKSYLLSLGIADPVTRESHGSEDAYHKELAKQICDMLEKPIMETGGLMVLTDIYCRVNRARGLELLSPEDLVHACKIMASLKLPLRLHIFDSGVMVLQAASHQEAQVAKKTAELLEERGCITAEELSHMVGISVILAKERLLSAEKIGLACRDDFIGGLHFYPNWFATKTI